MTSNHELFTIEPEWQPGNVDRPLWYLSERLRRGSLRIPSFQRDFIWKPDRIASWGKTVISKEAIGVIVTYHAKDVGADLFLADGFQRLSATLEIFNDPQHYDFKFGQDQWQAYCEAFSITVQHRIYQNHRHALTAFQNVNMGTACIPAEFHKGVLTLEPLGERIYREIPTILSKYGLRCDVINSNDRNRAGTALRDSLALFYQYVSETTDMQFWNASSRRIRDEGNVESVLADWLVCQTRSDVEQLIRSFEQFIASQEALITLKKENLNLHHRPMNLSLFRWFLHVAIWRKNTNRSVKAYEQLVFDILKHIGAYSVLPGNFMLPNTDPPDMIWIHTSNLSQLACICRAFKSDLYDGRYRRKAKAPKGYDVSHIVPFSIAGEGETIIEPATINRARGAKEITA